MNRELADRIAAPWTPEQIQSKKERDEETRRWAEERVKKLNESGQNMTKLLAAEEKIYALCDELGVAITSCGCCGGHEIVWKK